MFKKINTLKNVKRLKNPTFLKHYLNRYTYNYGAFLKCVTLKKAQLYVILKNY